MKFKVLLSAFLIFAMSATNVAAKSPPPPPLSKILVRSLDGINNNLSHPTWGKAGTQYIRVARPAYVDGISAMMDGPNARYVSNRIFNDIGQNLFSENDLSQWVWAWGQFLDHDLGLRNENPAEDISIPTEATDPLEDFTNDFGVIGMNRTPAALGTGTGINKPRQQINTQTSYIDGSQVYGPTNARLDWLREGSVDGKPSNNKATLLLPDGFLPTQADRPQPAPLMDHMGPLAFDSTPAVIAGDVRANENIALTGIQTLFAREHNRIVAALPSFLTQESKFQIARKIVGAEIEYITYTEFLPAVGVTLPTYRGYKRLVNASEGNEFATVGYRGHSMVHGEFELTGTYSEAQVDNFISQGIAVATDPDTGFSIIGIPLSVAFGNPALLKEIGLPEFLASLNSPQYKNDEQIDNTLRSVLFQVPTVSPADCDPEVVNPDCFNGITDLGAIDLIRARDHGIPRYNDLREAYGLPRVTSFTEITGEGTEEFPDDVTGIDDPAILDFDAILDRNGEPAVAEEDAITGVRHTTVAAKLKAIYGNVNDIDAFVGMLSEKHVPGSDLGELQKAIWTKQFAAVRDGDRFFYLNDPTLNLIKAVTGITYKHTLGEIITLNTGAPEEDNVFFVQ